MGLIKFLNNNNKAIYEKWISSLHLNNSELFTGRVQLEITNSMLLKINRIYKKFILEHHSVVQLADELLPIIKKTTILVSLVEIYEESTYCILQQDKTLPTEERENLESAIYRTKSELVRQIIRIMESRYQKKIHKQSKALKELFTPIMPVFERVIVVPIIGEVDTERSKQMMENILNGVVYYKAEIVLLDITGVPLINSRVAQHIIQMIRAIHIVGGQCMLIGCKPEFAKIFVILGVDLSNISTFGTLQDGVKEALEKTNRRISEVLC